MLEIIPMPVAPRSYYFLEKAAAILKKEWKGNYCGLELQDRDYAQTLGYGKGKGKEKEETDRAKALPKRLNLIITVKNPRRALGDKGSNLLFLKHKIDLAFGFEEDFLSFYLQRYEREFKPMRKGKGNGKLMDTDSENDERDEEVAAPKVTRQRTPRHEEPDLSVEEWKECASRGARLNLLLDSGKEFFVAALSPLRDRMMYAMRL